MGATEKRRESDAICRDMGDLSQRGEWRAVYQGCLLGVAEAFAAFLVALCGFFVLREHGRQPLISIHLE